MADMVATPIQSAASVAAGIRQGDFRASQLVADVLARVAESDDRTHAFLHVCADHARRLADQVDDAVAEGRDPGPLAGVAVAVKDNICTRGIETTCGSRILEGWIPPYDATVISRIVAAGGIPIGKTNMDEFGMGSSTENSAYGPTRNPRDVTRIPGGSSGGSAAAVAAGYSSLAIGSDTGGSIRQPAALCGVVGVKPTYGRVSRYGLVAYASSLEQVGPLAANVADAALLLQVIAGHDPLDSTVLSTAVPDYAQAVSAGVEGRRVAVVRELVDGVDPAIAARVYDAAETLEAAGAVVGEVSIPALRLGLSAYYMIAPAEASSNLARFDGVRYGLRVDGPDVETMMRRTRSEGFGPEVKRRIMLGTYVLSAGYYDAYYAKAVRVRSLIQHEVGLCFQRWDALLGAVTPTTAFRFGDRVDPMTMYEFDVCTIGVNLAGTPAMSVPFGADSEGLPIGIQVLGPWLGEEACLAVAGELESGQLAAS